MAAPTHCCCYCCCDSLELALAVVVKLNWHLMPVARAKETPTKNPKSLTTSNVHRTSSNFCFHWCFRQFLHLACFPTIGEVWSSESIANCETSNCAYVARNKISQCNSAEQLKHRQTQIRKLSWQIHLQQSDRGPKLLHGNSGDMGLEARVPGDWERGRLALRFLWQ